MSGPLPKPIFIPVSAIFIAVAVIFLTTQIIAGLDRAIVSKPIISYTLAIGMLFGLLTLHTFADPNKPRIRAATQILSFIVFMLIVLGNVCDTNEDMTAAIIVLIISLFLMRGLQWFTRRLRADLTNKPKRLRY